MAGLADIRQAIAGALKTLPSLGGRAYERIPESINVPCAVLGLPTVFYDQALRGGMHRVTLPVRVYVNSADAPRQQLLLDPYVDWSGPDSVYAALDADRSLGGVIDTFEFANPGLTKYGSYDVAGVSYLGAEWVLDIYAH